MTDEQYKIHLPAYDGPLDLLLDLIRKQEINIYDIPIARITEQYLALCPHDGGAGHQCGR